MRELRLGVAQGCTLDSPGVFPVLALGSSSPARIALANEEGSPLVLSPGEYFIELKLRALDGAATPGLELWLAGHSRSVAFVETEAGRWRASFVLEQRGDAVALSLAGSGSAAFAGVWINEESRDQEAAPTLRGGAVTLGRALFRKLPLPFRRSILSSARRARWLKTARDGGAAAVVEPLASPTDSCEALRADFENRAAVARGVRHPSFTEAIPAAQSAPDVKLIAFYLPQYHAIPENDAWWGKGFTEWTNVAKAQPQFVGHYQPRLPGELGFYDLTAPGAIAAQAKLARAYGISAFCFHYYWFAGKRLLERPLDDFLADISIDIEFCLCWANENWTRRWDGEDAHVLIGQEHSTEDHARVFADMARYMDDPRYMRIGGAPVLLVYRPNIIADAQEMIALWRDEARRRGWPGVFLVATNAFRFEEQQGAKFDAVVEFPPHGIVADRMDERLQWLNSARSGAVYSYEAVAEAERERLEKAPEPQFVQFPGVMPGWDNEARRPGAGTIYHGATPEAYAAWLKAAVARAKRILPPDRRLVFINAWNEWAEGAYLEPDRAYGRAFLVETARVIGSELQE